MDLFRFVLATCEQFNMSEMTVFSPLVVQQQQQQQEEEDKMAAYYSECLEAAEGEY